MRFFRLVPLLLLGFGIPDALAQNAARSWQQRLDLRTLPANTRPAEVTIAVDATALPADAPPLLASIAINGLVLGRHRLEPGHATRLTYPLQDRLLSVRNRIELAVSAPGCTSAACTAALVRVTPVGSARFRLAPPERAPGDFSQLVTRFRAGLTIEGTTPATTRLGTAIRAALAPAAPFTDRGPATVRISRERPRDIQAPIRFDLGPVELRRSDGARLLAPEVLDRMTVVQVLRFGERPLVWIRPGDRMPDRLELDSGNVAIFDGNRRLIAWSTRRDPAVQVRYAPGIDPDGEARRALIWRIALLLAWLTASFFLLRLWRRLPTPSRSRKATAA